MAGLRRTCGVLGFVLTLTAAACNQGAETPPEATGPAETGPAETGSGTTSLAGVCPDPLVVQMSWFPEMEYGWLWQLIGPNGTRDPENGIFRGPLGDTGIELEIRSGGPFLGGQQPVATLYQDRDIFLAVVDTDDIAKNYADFPTVAVLGHFDKHPQTLMFNPEKFDFQTVEDIRDEGTPVLYFEGSAYMDYLVGEGLLSADQVDGSYTGAPDRWVATDGGVVQTAFISQEPWRFENEIEQWQKPVGTILLADVTGYQPYGSLVVRQDALTESADCLAAVVPLMQQGIVDFANSDVQGIAEEISLLNEEIADFWQTSVEHNLAGRDIMLQHEIISNGPNGTIGDFELDRIADQIAIYRELFAARDIEVPADLTAEDVATNQFIDPSIGL